ISWIYLAPDAICFASPSFLRALAAERPSALPPGRGANMAHYFFHLRDGVDILLDQEGRDIEAADIERHALEEARAIIADDAKGGRILLDQRIDVENASGTIVLTLQFGDAVHIRFPTVS